MGIGECGGNGDLEGLVNWRELKRLVNWGVGWVGLHPNILLLLCTKSHTVPWGVENCYRLYHHTLSLAVSHP